MKILVANFGDIEAWTIPAEQVARLRARAPGHDVRHVESQADMVDEAGDADIAFSWRFNGDALSRAARLRWIQSPAAGVSVALLSDELRRRPILVTNSRGVNALCVAEHAFALLLALTRGVHTALVRQAEAVWAQNELTRAAPRVLRGLTLGLVGTGMIGIEVARLAHAFDMRVIATRRRPQLPTPTHVDEVLPATELPTLLRRSDIIVLAAPDTRETARLIGERELSLMKHDALLINVGRGVLVDEAALAAALADGRIAGAGLDVFAEEPLPASSPLWRLPNAILTPHVGGVRADYWTVAVDLFLDNLRRFEHDEPLVNLVDKDAGY